MFQKTVIAFVLYTFAGIVSSFAQETVTSDSLLREREKVSAILLILMYKSLLSF